VIWTGKAGTSEAANVGLQSLDSGKWIWDLKLPADAVDIYSRAPEHEKRVLVRVGCFLSSEVRWENADQKVLTFIRDLSVGGCYVAINSPLSLKTEVRIAFWLDDQTKIWSDGIVISSHPNVGMGVKFLGLSRHNLQAVERCLEHLSQPKTQSNVRSWFPTQPK
jgi:hypothetical protein